MPILFLSATDPGHRPELGQEHSSVTRCEACGWEDLPSDLDLIGLPDRDFSEPTQMSGFPGA